MTPPSLRERVEALPVEMRLTRHKFDGTTDINPLVSLDVVLKLLDAAPSPVQGVSEEMVERAVKFMLVRVDGLTEKGWLNERNDPKIEAAKIEARDVMRQCLTAALSVSGGSVKEGPTALPKVWWCSDCGEMRTVTIKHDEVVCSDGHIIATFEGNSR